MRGIAASLCVTLATLLATPASADDVGNPAAIDGPGVIFKDALLDRLVGDWVASGTILGGPLRHGIQAAWVLNHQFLQLKIVDLNPPKPDDVKYEAMVLIGYDNMSERYVAHWIDVFGGRASETLGYGTRTGDAIRFVFEYPDGPMHTTFGWDSATRGWTLEARQKTPAGKWELFMSQKLARIGSSGGR